VVSAELLNPTLGVGYTFTWFAGPGEIAKAWGKSYKVFCQPAGSKLDLTYVSTTYDISLAKGAWKSELFYPVTKYYNPVAKSTAAIVAGTKYDCYACRKKEVKGTPACSLRMTVPVENNNGIAEACNPNEHFINSANPSLGCVCDANYVQTDAGNYPVCQLCPTATTPNFNGLSSQYDGTANPAVCKCDDKHATWSNVTDTCTCNSLDHYVQNVNACVCDVANTYVTTGSTPECQQCPTTGLKASQTKDEVSGAPTDGCTCEDSNATWNKADNACSCNADGHYVKNSDGNACVCDVAGSYVTTGLETECQQCPTDGLAATQTTDEVSGAATDGCKCDDVHATWSSTTNTCSCNADGHYVENTEGNACVCNAAEHYVYDSDNDKCVCEADYYHDGTSCIPCGFGATSPQGSTECSCRGANQFWSSGTSTGTCTCTITPPYHRHENVTDVVCCSPTQRFNETDSACYNCPPNSSADAKTGTTCVCNTANYVIVDEICVPCVSGSLRSTDDPTVCECDGGNVDPYWRDDDNVCVCVGGIGDDIGKHALGLSCSGNGGCCSNQCASNTCTCKAKGAVVTHSKFCNLCCSGHCSSGTTCA
jgi:hypothetical protein